MAISIKADFNNDIRRFTVDPATFDAIQAAVGERFFKNANHPIKLTYHDDEGDLVTLASNEDLAFALKLMGKDAPLRLGVRERSPPQAANAERKKQVAQAAGLVPAKQFMNKGCNLYKFLANNPQVLEKLRADPSDVSALNDRPGLQTFVREHPQALADVLAKVELAKQQGGDEQQGKQEWIMAKKQAKLAQFLGNHPEAADKLRTDPTDLSPLNGRPGLQNFVKEHPEVLALAPAEPMPEPTEVNVFKPNFAVRFESLNKRSKLTQFLMNHPQVVDKLRTDPTDLSPLSGRPGLQKFANNHPKVLAELLALEPSEEEKSDSAVARLTHFLGKHPNLAEQLRTNPADLSPLNGRPGLKKLVEERPDVLTEILADAPQPAKLAQPHADKPGNKEAKLTQFLANNSELATQLRAAPADLSPLNGRPGLQKFAGNHPQALVRVLAALEANPELGNEQQKKQPQKANQKPAKLAIFLANNPEAAAQLKADPSNLSPLDGRRGLQKFVENNPQTLLEMLRRHPEMARRMENGQAPAPMVCALKRRLVRFLANHPAELQRLEADTSTDTVKEVFKGKPLMIRFMLQNEAEVPAVLQRAQQRLAGIDVSDTENDETATENDAQPAKPDRKCEMCDFAVTGVTPKFCCRKCPETRGKQHGARCLKKALQATAASAVDEAAAAEVPEAAAAESADAVLQEVAVLLDQADAKDEVDLNEVELVQPLATPAKADLKCVACDFAVTGVHPKFCCHVCKKSGGKQHGAKCQKKVVEAGSGSDWEIM